MSQWVTPKTIQPNSDFNGVQDIHPQEVYDLKPQVQIVDVRRPDEFVGEYGHIEGAELIVLDTIPTNLPRFEKSKTVILVCRSGGRSARATQFLQENGFTSVYNMQGGMMAWDSLNLPAVEKNK